ncbi:MAG: hypothetical protein DMF56_11100 [Acidobacteria bacterium]|nr:MAG: hypothetical protein DMF56_11100 [Acidobacteriota bacterium]
MIPDYRIDNLIAVATSILFLVLTGGGLLFVIRRRMKEQHELRRALIEKLSAEELIRLAESEGGRGWLRDVLVGVRDRHAAVERALQVIFAGVACGIASGYLHQKPLGAAGMILVAAGLGQLVATLIFNRRDKASDEK